MKTIIIVTESAANFAGDGGAEAFKMDLPMELYSKGGKSLSKETSYQKKTLQN